MDGGNKIISSIKKDIEKVQNNVNQSVKIKINT